MKTPTTTCGQAGPESSKSKTARAQKGCVEKRTSKLKIKERLRRSFDNQQTQEQSHPSGSSEPNKHRSGASESRPPAAVAAVRKRVAFARGPLETKDGHPEHEGQIATPLQLPHSFPATKHKPLTPTDVRVLEDLLGDENRASFERLKRRAEFMRRWSPLKPTPGKKERAELTQGLAASHPELTQGLAASDPELTQGLAASDPELTQGLAASDPELGKEGAEATLSLSSKPEAPSLPSSGSEVTQRRSPSKRTAKTERTKATLSLSSRPGRGGRCPACKIEALSSYKPALGKKGRAGVTQRLPPSQPSLGQQEGAEVTQRGPQGASTGAESPQLLPPSNLSPSINQQAPANRCLSPSKTRARKKGKTEVSPLFSPLAKPIGKAGRAVGQQHVATLGKWRRKKGRCGVCGSARVCELHEEKAGLKRCASPKNGRGKKGRREEIIELSPVF